MMKTYSVVVAFNGEQWIERCLDSLLLSQAKASLIVVDNNSKDSTVNIIKRKYPSVVLIENKKNYGFGQANNAGIRYALSHHADFVLLLNQDAAIDSEMLRILLETARVHPEYGILSPLHFDYDAKTLDPGFLENLLDNRLLLNDALCKQPKPVYEIQRVNAAIWLVTRRLFETIGGFDPIFVHGGEDHDLSARARYHGFKVGLVPNAKAYHYHSYFGYGRKFTLPQECNLLSAQWLYRLKDPEIPFYKTLLAYLKIMVFGVLYSMLLFRYRSVLLKICVSKRVLLQLVKIRRHRNLSLRISKNWL